MCIFKFKIEMIKKNDNEFFDFTIETDLIKMAKI